MTKCTTCGGTYPSTQPDGLRYFHACAPLSDVEVGIALGAGGDPTKWTAQNKIDIAAAPRLRPNARNENVPDAATLKVAIAAVPKTDVAAYWKAVNAILDTAIVAAGAGTTVV